ncbi:hypothetical protein LQZ51_14070 [Elizabethkingia anophelis]|nr:hypothetical protein [Elizabethkingia anophelis]
MKELKQGEVFKFPDDDTKYFVKEHFDDGETKIVSVNEHTKLFFVKNDREIIVEKTPFKMTTKQEPNLYLSLIKQGLNDGQISDVFQRIKKEEDYLKYLKS